MAMTSNSAQARIKNELVKMTVGQNIAGNMFEAVMDIIATTIKK